MNDRVSCGIKTFLREEKLESCLASLVGKGFHSVIVSDDGNITPGKRAVYERFSNELPLHLIELPFDIGVGIGRNIIAEHCKTEYLLFLDDDQMVPDNIGDLYTIMEHDHTLGGISGYWFEYGNLRCGATNLFFRGNYIVKDIPQRVKAKTVGTLTYFIYDFIPNSTLFRTSCLLEIPWDPFYKIGSEHLDFYLLHLKSNKWKFAVTPNVIIEHDSREHTTEYKEMYRKNAGRLETSANYLNKKWGVRGVIENKRHVAQPGVFVPRQNLISQLIRIGIRPDKAVKVAKHAHPWVFMFFTERT